MYIQGMAQQTQIFLLCVGFGFIAGAAYDSVRFIRKSLSAGYKAIIAQDILFFMLLTPAAFLFMLCINDGELRLYPYLGMTAGFFIWYFTLGIPVRHISDKVSSAIRRIIRPVFSSIKEIFEKIIKKEQIKFQNHLKNQ